jgi:hypothetical protein
MLETSILYIQTFQKQNVLPLKTKNASYCVKCVYKLKIVKKCMSHALQMQFFFNLLPS